jgi:hypothetical protein
VESALLIVLILFELSYNVFLRSEFPVVIFITISTLKRCPVRLWFQEEDPCLIYVICVCLHIAVSNKYCVVFLFCFPRLVYPMLPVSLDCPFFDCPHGIFYRLFAIKENSTQTVKIVLQSCKNIQTNIICRSFLRG